MLPPGRCSYYFLVYGDGRLLLRHNGVELEPTSPHRTGIEKGYLGTQAGEIPSYATLTRPDQYFKDINDPAISAAAKSSLSSVAAGRGFDNDIGGDNLSAALAVSSSSSPGGSLSIPEMGLNQRRQKVHSNCGVLRVDPTTEFFQILDEERTKKFHTINIDDTAEEDDDEEEVVEEIEEWHKRNSIFAARRFETGGSFLDGKYDFGPERKKTAEELAVEVDLSLLSFSLVYFYLFIAIYLIPKLI
jgi:hypothetical protein